MQESGKTESWGRRYLLGKLSESQTVHAEETFFIDDVQFAELEMAEDELIDQFVRNELTADDKERLEAKIANSPRLVERVKFARLLADKADAFVPPVDSDLTPAQPTKTAPAWWTLPFGAQRALGIAAAVIVIVVGLAVSIVWFSLKNKADQLAIERVELEQQKEDLRRQREMQASPQQTPQTVQTNPGALQPDMPPPVASPVPGRSQTSIASVILLPGGVRSGGKTNLITVRPGDDTIQARLVLPTDEYRTFNITVQDVDQKLILRRTGVKSVRGAGKELVVSIPTKLVRTNDYIIRVDGVTTSKQIESLADYSLRVKRE